MLKIKRVITMTDMELLKLAEGLGFRAAMIDAKDIPVDGQFRK